MPVNEPHTVQTPPDFAPITVSNRAGTMGMENHAAQRIIDLTAKRPKPFVRILFQACNSRLLIDWQIR